MLHLIYILLSTTISLNSDKKTIILGCKHNTDIYKIGMANVLAVVYSHIQQTYNSIGSYLDLSLLITMERTVKLRILWRFPKSGFCLVYHVIKCSIKLLGDPDNERAGLIKHIGQRNLLLICYSQISNFTTKVHRFHIQLINILEC